MLIIGLVLSASSLRGGDERPIFPEQARIRVQYQAKRPNSGSWTTYSTVLSGTRSESMAENQLARRHPGYVIRILSASAGKDVQTAVCYQIRRNNSSWTTGTTTLRTALTESMARNQISARYPGAEVRILSMVTK